MEKEVKNIITSSYINTVQVCSKNTSELTLDVFIKLDFKCLEQNIELLKEDINSKVRNVNYKYLGFLALPVNTFQPLVYILSWFTKDNITKINNSIEPILSSWSSSEPTVQKDDILSTIEDIIYQDENMKSYTRDLAKNLEEYKKYEIVAVATVCISTLMLLLMIVKPGSSSGQPQFIIAR